VDDLQTVLPMILNQRRLAPPDENLLIAVSGIDGSGSRANLRGFSEICALHAVGCSEIPPHRDGNPTITSLEADA
jgi:hypothetical protein